MAEQITVEVVLALPEQQIVRRVSLANGATALEALQASGLEREWPERVDPQRLGVHARRVAPEHRVNDGDRIEIYRPLALDPKEARRRRAHARG